MGGRIVGYFIKIYNLIWELNLLLPLFLIFTILLLIWVLKNPLIIKVKINNFFIAFSSLILYVFIYIMLLFYLRISLLGSSVNLKSVLNKITTYFININQLPLYNQLILYLFIIILILLWLFLVLKLRNLLVYKIWQLLMYYFFITNEEGGFKYPQFETLISSFYFRYTLRAFTNSYINPLIKKLGYGNHGLIIKKLIRFTPTLILLCIFIGECVLNNFILYYIYYYLPIYLLIILWIQVSESIDWYCAEVIFESALLIKMAYEYPDVIYVNIAEVDKLLLEAALLKNKKTYNLIYETYLENGISTYDVYTHIRRISRFKKEILTDGRIIFNNSFRGQYFEEGDIRKVGDYYEVDDEDNSENN